MDTDTVTDIPTNPCLEAYDTLIKTYNASVIKKFPLKLRDACFEQAKITTDLPEWSEGKRSVLAKLIENHQNLDRRPIANYIIGPMNISCHWSKHYEKMIYILGEYHENSDECYEKPKAMTQHIIDYLKQYFLNTHAFIDFYLEMPGFVGPGYSFKFNNLVNRINIMRSIFQKCVDQQTRNTEQDCYLSRMHYFDIREGKIKGGINPISIFLEQANLVWRMLNRERIEEWEDNEEWKRYETITVFVRNNSSILEVFKNAMATEDRYKELWHSQIKHFPLIQKELDRVHPPEIKEAIQKFIEKELNKLIQNEGERKVLSESSKYILDLCEVYVKSKKDMKVHINKLNLQHYKITLRSHLEKIITICITYNALVIDAYLLARLFKKFDINSKDPKKRRSTDEPEEAHNIIIYAGNLHSQVYRKFLKELTIKDPTGKSAVIPAFEDLGHAGTLDDKKIPKYCIEMGLFKQPLFSIWDPTRKAMETKFTPTSIIEDQMLTFPLNPEIQKRPEFPPITIPGLDKKRRFDDSDSDSSSDSDSGSSSDSGSRPGSGSRSRSRSRDSRSRSRSRSPDSDSDSGSRSPDSRSPSPFAKRTKS